ncbi:MAG: hypothetical protein M3Y64_00215 [Gemmatimonadota bacterium]|nr:hypothetical protein [Gemmatimonadota bacterium]
MSKRSNVTPANDDRRNALNENVTAPDSINSDVGESGSSGERTAKGDGPLPEELTGRASSGSEDLVSLFNDKTADHLTDGFRGGQGDFPEADVETADENTDIER